MQNKPTKSEYFAFLYIVFVILLNSYAAHISPEKGEIARDCLHQTQVVIDDKLKKESQKTSRAEAQSFSP